jgi:hypothetical protein
MSLPNSPTTTAESRHSDRLSRNRLASTSRFSHLTFVLVLVGSLLTLTHCDNPGSVGRSFGPKDPSLKLDTIRVTGMTTTTLKAFSGGLQFMSVGTYRSDVFGTYEAIGLIQPILISELDILNSDADMSLRLQFAGITGDTNAVSTFEVYEITRRWRSTTWTLDSLPQLDATFLTTFSVRAEDSVDVSLPPSFRNKYLDYQRDGERNRDSTYLENVFGFAIRGVDNNKIVAVNVAASGMFITQNDTTLNNKFVIFRQSANSLVHTPSTMVLPSDVTRIESNFSQVGKLDLVLSESLIGARFPQRVELVLYEDTLTLAANTPPGHVWMDQFQVPIYLLEDYETNLAIFNNPNIFVTRLRDGSFRSNLTSFYNSVITQGGQPGEMYFLSHRFNGIIRPRLFFNTSSARRSPALITTTFVEN